MTPYIPLVASSGGKALIDYLAADPRRQAIYDNLAARLEPLGRVGNLARFYVIRNRQRRDVFRAVLSILHTRWPTWAYEDARAAALNRDFREQYRDEYNAFRRNVRSAAKEAAQADAANG